MFGKEPQIDFFYDFVYPDTLIGLARVAVKNYSSSISFKGVIMQEEYQLPISFLEKLRLPRCREAKNGKV